MFAAPSYSRSRKAALSVRGKTEKTAVILDRHPLWLDALERLLDGVGVNVVGKTTSAASALKMVGEMRPMVFLTEYDAIVDSEDGLGSLRRAATDNPGVYSVVLSTHHEAADIEAAFAAGASVYCMKTAEPEDLAAAIRRAFDDSIHYASSPATLTERPPVES